MPSTEKNQNLFKRFGRYLILDHLVSGGMAQICRARYLGEEVNKIVAIKMIRSQYSEDPEYKKMFMNEIKVAFGLLHPNIAQTYDYGHLDGHLYAAIEYVDGANLKQYLGRLKENKWMFPVEIAVFTTMQVCQALTYAHRFTDKLTGQELKIIHRDISPHNIMLTYDGTVKVIDFGIAKADMASGDKTKAGTIKGKLSYLAPEYIEGLPLDPRYDQFCVGLTLWELLCGKKLFKAENELAVIKLIQKCEIPSTTKFNSKVPAELDQIILKSLSKNREERFESMDQFNRALSKFLYTNFPEFNPTDLERFSKKLFKEEIKRDREKLIEFGKMDVSKYFHEVKEETRLKKIDPSLRKSGSEKDKKNVLDLKIEEGTSGIQLEESDFSDVSQRIKLGDEMRGRKTKNGPSRTVSKFTIHESTRSTGRKDDSSLSKKLSSTKVREKQLEIIKFSKVIGVIAVLIFIAVKRREILKATKGFLTSFQSTSKKEDQMDRQVSSVARSKRYFIRNYNGQRIFLNNQEVNYSDMGIEIDFGIDVTLRIQDDHKEFVFVQFTSSKDAPAEISIPQTKSIEFGLLKSRSEYGKGDKLNIDYKNQKLIYSLPLEIKLPVGRYRGFIQYQESGGIKDIKFEIREDSVTFLEGEGF